jgi:hypothetical protein
MHGMEIDCEMGYGFTGLGSFQVMDVGICGVEPFVSAIR